MTTMKEERMSKIKFASVDDDICLSVDFPEIKSLIQEAVSDVGYILCDYENSEKEYEEWIEGLRSKEVFEYELVVTTKVELRKVAKIKKEISFVKESFEK